MQAYPRAVGRRVLAEDDAEAGRGESAPGDLDEEPGTAGVSADQR
jgi:hypothetical protein